MSSKDPYEFEFRRQVSFDKDNSANDESDHILQLFISKYKKIKITSITPTKLNLLLFMGLTSIYEFYFFCVFVGIHFFVGISLYNL